MGDVGLSQQAFVMAKTAALKQHPSFAVAPTCYQGIQQIKQGLLPEALATFREGLRFATLPDGHEAAIAGFPNIRLGDLLRQVNELALASQHLQRSLEECLRFQQVDFLTDAYICLGRYQLAQGNFDGVFTAVEKADQIVQSAKIDQWVLSWLDDLRLRAWLATGNLRAAALWA
jgi:LuxR family maltose regulon positive regulatory protein